MTRRPARTDYRDRPGSGIEAATMELHHDWMLNVMEARPPAPGEGAPRVTGDNLREHSLLAPAVE